MAYMTGNVTSSSLADFFSALRASLDNAKPASIVGLRRFFLDVAKVRPKPIRPARPLPDNTVDPTRMRRFLQEFGSLEHRLRTQGDFINVWTVSGLGSNELRNTAVLSWLFDPNQSHGRGPELFKNFIQYLSSTAGKAFALRNPIHLPYSLSTECYPLGNSESRVDIVVDGNDYVAFIEVKIEAGEGERQIERYLELACAKAKVRGIGAYVVIYLSPERLSQTPINVISATWNDVAKVVEKTVDPPRNFSDRILLQFARHILQF